MTSSPTSEALRRIGSEQVGCFVTEAGEVWQPASLLRDAANEIDRLRDALLWCGGSPSFAPEGEAYEGWLRVCASILRPTT